MRVVMIINSIFFKEKGRRKGKIVKLKVLYREK